MSFILLSETEPRARKRYRCIWCGQHIEAGDKHLHVVGIFEGDFQNQRWHPECNSAFLAELKADRNHTGEIDRWSNERPKPAGKEGA